MRATDSGSDPTLRIRRSLAKVVAALLASGLLACGSDSPESQVRDTVAAAVEAVRERDLRGLAERVAAEYADEKGNDRRALLALVTFHLGRQRSVHVAYRLSRIDVRDGGRARVVVYAAVAGRPIAENEPFGGLDADFLRIDGELRRAGRADWRLTWANWKRVRAGELPF